MSGIGDRKGLLTRRQALSLLAVAAAAQPLAPALARAPDVSFPPRPRPSRVPQDAASLLHRARLGGEAAFLVVDRASGAVLEALNLDEPMPPASVAKTLTTLYAMDALGGRHRFSTRLIAAGPVNGGTLEGDLILAGGGDPVLTTDDLGAMVAELKRAGVQKVTGEFRVWGGALPRIDQIDPGQPPYVGYNPAIGGLNLNFNRVHFEWRRGAQGYATTMDARAERYNAAVNMARIRVVDRDVPLFTYTGGAGIDNWTVASRALGQAGSRWLPVRRPDLYAGEVFRALAAQQGIRLADPVAGDGPPAGTVLVEHLGEELGPVLRDMLKYSVNLSAEVIGLGASLRTGAVDTLAASAARMTDWAGARYGTGPLGFADHSGLGGTTRISPAQMVRLLLPEGPLPGLLRTHGDPAKGYGVVAKTGTLNFVSGLAGYVAQPSGRELCFAIFTADVARRDRLSQAEREAPPGAKEWAGRARQLQLDLIDRWATLYA